MTYKNLGLPPQWYGAVGWVFPTWARTHALDTGEAVNLLKGAIVTADRILTVSQVIGVIKNLLSANMLSRLELKSVNVVFALYCILVASLSVDYQAPAW